MEVKALKDLKPEATSIKLEGKDFHIRPVTLNDWIWMQKKYGEVNVDAMSMKALCQILYRLLDNDGKAHFQLTKEPGFDDDGIHHTEIIKTGPERLAESMEGLSSMTQIVEVFRKAIGISEKIQKELEAEDDGDVKKKLMAAGE